MAVYVMLHDDPSRVAGQTPGRFRGNVVGVLRLCALVQRLAGRSQRLHEHGADLRRQPSADDHHAVFVLHSRHAEQTLSRVEDQIHALPPHPAVYPPSTGSETPVTKLASSLAR